MIHAGFSEQRAVPACAVCRDECAGIEAGGCELRRRVLEALWAMLSIDGTHFELSIDGERVYIPDWDHRRFITTIAGAARLGERVLLGAAPRTGTGEDAAVKSAHVLWARVDDGEGAKALKVFRPAPTLILREGETVKRMAFWWISRPLSYGWLERANERLSARLKGVRGEAAPEFMFAPPFTLLGRGQGGREKRVVVEHIDPVFYGADQVVGAKRPDRRALPDAPDRDGWRKQSDAAKAA